MRVDLRLIGRLVDNLQTSVTAKKTCSNYELRQYLNNVEPKESVERNLTDYTLQHQRTNRYSTKACLEISRSLSEAGRWSPKKNFNVNQSQETRTPQNLVLNSITTIHRLTAHQTWAIVSLSWIERRKGMFAPLTSKIERSWTRLEPGLMPAHPTHITHPYYHHRHHSLPKHAPDYICPGYIKTLRHFAIPGSVPQEPA
ncbi:hypothetical protein J1614_002968 [Plenodomus biglobosus]|nr:hypothetical protein J1614_002968 [Plenodomus biglobosus]